MNQETLSGFAISIECELSDSFNYDSLIDEFVCRKVRKVSVELELPEFKLLKSLQ